MRTLRSIHGVLIAVTLLTAVALAPPPAGAIDFPVVINEIQVSTTGTDWEFVELFGEPDTDLTDLTLIGIESDSGSLAGTIDLVVSLLGQSLAADGFWLGISPAGSATYGVTGEMTIADNSFENSTATYFLVSGFTGAQGADLDLDDDGTLDSAPWVAVVDAINIRDSDGDFDYGAPSVGPDGSYLPSGTFRCPDGPTGTFDGNIHNFSVPDGTPGAPNLCPEPPSPEACGDEYTPIFTIQGAGLASSLDGTVVSTEGVVVGDFQDGKNGFFLQDPDGDGDPSTSDGIFVYSTLSDVNPGDRVRVRGTVDEYYDLTEITAVSQIWTCSTGVSVAPTVVTLPVTSLDDFEAYEGMLITLPQPLYISEYYNFDRYGEILLTNERQFQPTAIYEPGSPEAAQLALANSLGRITLDDGRSPQNPDPAIHPNGSEFTLDNLFRGGDSVQNVTGALDYNFGLYKVQPTQGADYTPANPRPELPENVGGDVTVASCNVLNYFTTLDLGAYICGPAGDQECRGADTPEEFTRQRDKIVAALAVMDTDVVGLIEIENFPGDVPTADLVSGLNDVMGEGSYDYVATGPIGTDAIRVALIYKPAAVSPVGPYAILDSSVDARFLDDYNRPVLAQTFQETSSGGIFTVAVAHLKSKVSSCNAIGDPDTGDGSGNCNLTRTAAAEALVDWLATDPTGSGDGDFLIIGDVNSYGKEDPIDALLAGGYTDLLSQFVGEDAYSYLYEGQLGYLDHALANDALLDEVTGAAAWHINADEPDIIDYDMTYKPDAQDALYAPDPYRASDHDPVITGLLVCDEVPPTLEVTVSPDMLWPANHKYVTVTATVVAADDFDPSPTVELVSVTSNEPDNGDDDGDTVNDIVIVDDSTFKLRAERSGSGTGRVYLITYAVTDACGNSTQQSAAVTVPLSQGS